MGLIYCGIDEAGYGPMLGPLCVGLSAFRLESWDAERGAPDLWQLLGGAVCRNGGDKRQRIAVADSKKLKLSNQLKTKHPLTHLERGVLSFAGLLPVEPVAQARATEPDAQARGRSAPLASDAALFAALGVKLEPHGWYGGEPAALPLACTAKEIAIARNKLTLACEGCGVSPVAMACIAVGEREFNEVVRTGGSKGHVTGQCFARYLRRVVERWGGGPDDVRVVCDRHGGRTSYAGMIEGAVRGLACEVETLEESDRCSRYALRRIAMEPDAQARVNESVAQARVTSGAGARASEGVVEDWTPPPDPLTRGAGGGAEDGAPAPPGIVIQFRPEAEDAHLPVALASMTAKLVRELAMARFNRYWCGRVPELKPTAGYVQDARRWLEDVEGVLCDDEREAMVRMV